MQRMRSFIRFKGLNNSCSQTGTEQACGMVHGCSGVLRCWAGSGMLTALGCFEEELWGKGLVQVLLRIPWSSVSDLCWEDLSGEMELCRWSDVGKPNQHWLHLPCRVMGKGSSVSPGSVPSSRSWPLCPGCRSDCNCWLFPAFPNFSQLRALGTIYFTPACEDFMWAFPFHHFQLWFGGSFFFCLSVLFCAGQYSQLEMEAVKLWWGGSSPRLGPGRGWLCLFLPVLGWGRTLCLSPPVGQTGETGAEGWFGARPTAGAAPGLKSMDFSVSSAWSCHWAAGVLQWPRLSVVPSGEPSRDTNCPALVLDPSRCKSHLTFSFRSCDLFSELLASVRDRNTSQFRSFPNYCVWKRLGHSLVLLLGSEKKKFFACDSKKCKKFCFFWFLTLS